MRSMGAKVWGTHQARPSGVDEIFFQNASVSLCLLVSRRARTMRVIDFRAGPSQGKRLLVLSLAKREGVSKIFTLVERDEVQTWIKLGFAKEGTIPGFYRRSDAFLLGCSTASVPHAPTGDPEDVPEQSEMRLTIAGASAVMTPAQARMERTIAAAKRELKDDPDAALPHAKIAPASETESRRAVSAAVRSGRALTTFAPFGRDVERRHFVGATRGGFELHASVESQSCFSNAYLELLEAPRTDAEKLATAGVLRAFCEKLHAEDVTSCFSLAPSDDLALAWAYLQNGFRRTGLLLEQLPGERGERGGSRKDAILWARKLVHTAEQ